jgi:thiol-disulfide isomerase/thioredoxin
MKTRLVLFVTLCLCSITGLNLADSALKPFTGRTPPLSLESLDGESVDLRDFRSKLLLVNFWATYCPPCRVEIPSMNRLQARMGDDFVILAVNMGESADDVQRFVEEVEPEFRILLDQDGSALQEWKVFAVPSSFIVDREGSIRYTLYGATEWDSDEMIALLTSLQ